MKKNKIVLSKLYSKVAVLLIIILVVVLVFKALNDGIKINDISIAGIKVEGLYLKLDKKLILTINNIDISKYKQSTSSKPSNISDMISIVKQAIIVSSFFERLDIQHIRYDNESSSIYFDGYNYKVDMPDVIALFNLEKTGSDILLNVNALDIKNKDINISGQILYLDKDNIFAFDMVSYLDNHRSVINYKGQTNLKQLEIVVDTNSIKSIELIAPYVKSLDEDVYDWIYKKTEFENLVINSAHLHMDNIKSNDIGKQIIKNLYVDANINGVKLSLDSKLSQIKSDNVKVVFDKGAISFCPDRALYDGLQFDRSKVVISDFLNKQALLSIYLETKKAVFDKRIADILNIYDVSVPIIQKDGIASGFITLDILLPSADNKISLKQNGRFHIKDSNVSIAGVDLFTKSSDILLDDNYIYINQSNIKIDSMIDIIANAVVDLDKKYINLYTYVNRLNLSSDSIQLATLSNKVINSNINFNDDKTLFDLPEYNISLTYNDNVDLYINDISKIAAISPILRDIDVTSGSLHVKTSDFKNIYFDGNINDLNYPIYNLDNTKIDSIQVEGKVTPSHITISSGNNINLDINLNTSEISLAGKDIIIDINEYLDSNIPILNNDGKEGGSTSSIKIEASNSLINLFNYTISLNKAFLNTTKDGFIANGFNGNGIAKVNYSNGVLDVEANNFNDKFINTFFNQDVVSGGSFGLKGRYKDGKFLCNITMLTTSIRNMTGLQNILSLIDTIPSLVAFRLPGFSVSGYEVDNADIIMGIDSKLIAIDDINIKGSSVDIIGNGIVDLENKDVNMELELSTIKSLSSILNKIPIIGYLILGEDGKISTKLSVKGTIDNPKTEISLLKDTINAPVNILKRIFKPFEILSNEIKNESDKRKNNRNIK